MERSTCSFQNCAIFSAPKTMPGVKRSLAALKATTL